VPTVAERARDDDFAADALIFDFNHQEPYQAAVDEHGFADFDVLSEARVVDVNTADAVLA
jgi:hypothetical protein